MNKQLRKSRIVIEGVAPEIDSGRFPIKRTVGEAVRVEADVFADGHDVVTAELLFRRESESDWNIDPMVPLVNDRRYGEFRIRESEKYRYTVRGWVDHFASWRKAFLLKAQAGQEVGVDLLEGIPFIEAASDRAVGAENGILQEIIEYLTSSADMSRKVALISDPDLVRVMDAYPDRSDAQYYARELSVCVDRQKARFSAWYEMFPRSSSPDPDRHGTFKDCEDRLPYVAGMGFDVLYFPPIHPIGKINRKGRNNTPIPGPNDPGSPWAIGSDEGGHTAIHPQLGTLEDFKRLVAKASDLGVDIALDLAFQCAPDHPWVKEHPEWFKRRADNSIQFAENPPKKYEDIYPLNFESDDWWRLWQALRDVTLFWVEQGIRIFRIDNPHTKPFPFWEWFISEVKKKCPDAVFLSEAFTRPKVMYELAKLGFTQSYTYFAWRNTKYELTSYFTELSQTSVREYFRPNLWPNTPDILTEYLQIGGRPAFTTRLVLAATLGANYGIYGPAFELMDHEAREFGSEEYMNSEKYEIRHWDIRSPDSLRHLITRLNRIRRENEALQYDHTLQFHLTDNEQILFYSKHNEDLSNVILCAVNLDPHHAHSAWVEVPLKELGIDSERPFQVHDLITGARYLWQGSRNFLKLDPLSAGSHVFRVRFKTRTERDFDYYM